MKNIHILSTDKPSRLLINREDTLVLTSNYYSSSNPQNICITSDEEIKKGDYVLYEGEVCKVLQTGIMYNDDFTIRVNNEYTFINHKYSLKIILTTDQELISDGVQAIDDEFLEWFVKNPSCEEVEVMKMFNMIQLTSREYIYYIIIPKEETNGCIGSNGVSDPKLNEVQLNQPKQETLEEAKKRILDSNYMNKNDADIFEMGAKWQAARLYDVEEVYSIARMCLGMKESGKTDIEIGACLERYRKK